MSIELLLQQGMQKLKENKVNEPMQKARRILSNILNENKEYLIVNSKKNVDSNIEKAFTKNIDRLINNEPLQYIIQNQEFMKLNFFVDENVLIPRQDTEILVEEVLRISEKMKKPQILDLCTGSGAIGISLACYIKDGTTLATDISIEALKVANLNANNNNVENRMRFIQSDLFENIEGKFDIIVSNPPYIKKEEIKFLDKEVQKEPAMALDGGIDGLDFYRKIIDNAYKFLKESGYLCLEIGYNQKEGVIKILKKNSNYKKVYSKKDLYGNDRIVIANI